MIPFYEFGGKGPVAHFVHANGYPPECYLPLLEKLAKHLNLFAMYQRPLWEGSEPKEISNWKPLTRDFLDFLDDRKSEPIIAIGHSLGGTVSLRAALQHPERFHALILIDPVIFPPHVVRIWQLVRAFKLEYRLHPFIRNATRRRRTFESREKLFELYRRKAVFRYFSDESLRSVISGLTLEKNGRYELIQSPEWEARIYITAIWQDMDIWRGISHLKIPLLIVRGAETDTFWESTSRLMIKRLPSAEVITIPNATHLVPLEQPDEVTQCIFDFLEEKV